MDWTCWIASWVGVLVGVVLTRIWLALRLDPDDEDGPHAQR